ncbi:hypothetical protein AGDE_15072 [Angomonas deanei]|uniref:Uncharacterized protein n=1 Tax=Angomonas deanei TaxID=59799 RepID=A0A7G2CMQ3_9TRYP|nr:hypothetical protein AGDE_15072 [Angomonas deanei]CAD2221120.1 hypothetical protein, conserved [Angomonas deanei]|eukprot:EPY19731.1 hypothetical protein AGDE_15072 [Angomonas deanei]
MLALIPHALFFAILLILVVVPPLYIFDPEDHVGESLGPPPAGTVTTDASVSDTVRQKLYLLFVIPVCACLNALFLYFLYYRPVRFTQYRVEQNVFSLHQILFAGMKILKDNNIFFSQDESAAWGPPSMIMPFDCSAVPSDHRKFKGTDGPGVHNAAFSTGLHARPANVEKNSFTTWAMSPSINELRIAVEQNYIVPANIAERNFQHAIEKLVEGHQKGDDGFYSSNNVVAASWPSDEPPSKKRRDSSRNIARERGAFIVAERASTEVESSASISRGDISFQKARPF